MLPTTCSCTISLYCRGTWATTLRLNRRTEVIVLGLGGFLMETYLFQNNGVAGGVPLDL